MTLELPFAVIADYQFGKKVTGKHYRERGDGDHTSILILDMKILNYVISTLADLYGNDTHSTIICNDMSFPFFERSLFFTQSLGNLFGFGC